MAKKINVLSRNIYLMIILIMLTYIILYIHYIIIVHLQLNFIFNSIAVFQQGSILKQCKK